MKGQLNIPMWREKVNHPVVWSRLEQIANAYGDLVVVTRHAIRADAGFVRDRFLELGMLLRATTGQVNMRVELPDERSSVRYDRGDFGLEKRWGMDWTKYEALQTLASWYVDGKGDGYAMLFVRESFSDELGTAFERRPGRWSIAYRNESEEQYGRKDPAHSPVALHLAKLLVAYNLVVWQRKDNNGIFEKIIKHQLSEYLENGSIKNPKVKNLKSIRRPYGLFTVSDDGDCVGWKHCKFCPRCGKSLSHYCFFSEAQLEKEDCIESIEYLRDEPCGSCFGELVEASFNGKIKTKKDEDWAENLISQYLSESELIKYIQKRMGRKLSNVKWDAKQFKKFWSAYHDYFDGDEGDGPEDACSCPSLGAEDRESGAC